MRGTYLIVEEVAAILRCTPRAVHGKTAVNAIPLRRLQGSRRVLFVADEIEAWIDGAELEIVDGGRVVRPKLNAVARDSRRETA